MSAHTGLSMYQSHKYPANAFMLHVKLHANAEKRNM